MTATTLALIGLLAAGPAHAKKDTDDCLRTKIWDTYGDGWAVRASTDVDVAFGKTQFYKVSLLKGRAYRVLTCAESSVKNLDILLYDAEGRVLGRDKTTDRDPQLAYVPEKTGIYYIVLYMRDQKDINEVTNTAWALIHNDPDAIGK